MDLLKNAFSSGNSIKNAIFLKEDSSYEKHIENLTTILSKADGDLKEKIEEDLKLLSYGKAGEDAVAFELKNSFIPMLVLHGLNIVYEDLKAQIDYLIVTRKFILVVECKNLFGNLQINSNGDFVRMLSYKGINKKEGIYSPITQLTRHMEILKQIKKENFSNFFMKSLFEKFFNDNYKSVVVLANPKTVIDMKYAKKELKDKVIRCDQLSSYIRDLLKNCKDNPVSNDKEMYSKAQIFLDLHREDETNYATKYHPYINLQTINSSNENKEKKNKTSSSKTISYEGTPLYSELKEFRLKRSREEQIKAYFIYNNAQLEDLIKYMPSNFEELQKVNGFNSMKCDKYGKEILLILEKYRY